MLSESIKEITHISEQKEVNTSNYFEALAFIDGIYVFLNKISAVFNDEKFEIKFLPSFVGMETAQKYGLPCSTKESEMKVFKITSPLFSEDNIADYSQAVSDKLGVEAESVDKENDYILVVLK